MIRKTTEYVAVSLCIMVKMEDTARSPEVADGVLSSISYI